MSGTETRSINVLVVDDETIVLSLVRDALEDEGYEITTAVGGDEALQALDSRPVDLLITDIRMPHMDGTELVRRARERNPHIGVIYMTGYANLNSAKDAIKQGAFDYILKPFELTEIRQAVHKAAGKLRERAGQDSGEQLERLSDLNQMLVTVGDRKSLASVSLRFAMMHFDATQGALLHWDRERTAVETITIHGDQLQETALDSPAVREFIRAIDPASFREPVIVTSPERHPLAGPAAAPEIRAALFPSWLTEGSAMVVMPINRANILYGIIMIRCSPDATALTGTDTRLLNIAAGQLAVSLENLFLLEETQTAYARLKEMQDETIQLEKLATRGEMSAEIGHELNNFLGVVAGNISLLDHQLKKSGAATAEKYMSAIQTNIEKMKQFTSNLMDLTPIASKKETVYFDQVLAEVIDYLTPQKRFRGVSIDHAVDHESIPFEADSIHIQQLLYNLFNNAADATRGCARREIVSRVEYRPGEPHFRFVIRDTGVGIEPELLAKAFEQKFTTKPDGHGFGLLVCKRIIDAHSGRLHVDSTPGEGTAISIEFPVAGAADSVDATAGQFAITDKIPVG
ncbi:MAG TPA: response regulator [candidate division Zixibacteria bacterium]|nr:response regulator [candidate division Zixibacteria bacterium]